MTSTQLDELFTRIDLTPVGPEERDLIEQAIRLAEEADDERGAYLARMRLTSSAHMSGDTDAMFSAFAWCIARNEQDPGRFPQEVAGNDLLFQYKWMAGRLGSNPAFSRVEVQALTDDMSRRYREAGVSQSGVLQSLVSTAVLSGDIDEAARHQRERDLIPRDDYSHCEACVRSTDARLAQLRGDEAEALRLFDEIIEQDLACGEEPEAAQAEALLALLRAGRIDDAVAHHRQSYRAARALPDGFSIIADHLVFCAVTGNAARGLAILERHVHELGRDPLDEAATLHQLLAVGVLLDAVVQAGQGDALVRGSDDPRVERLLGASDGPRTAASFAEQAWAAAATVAGRFDARNGNDFYARQVASRRALADERYDVPLEGTVFAPAVPSAEPEPVDAAAWLARARDVFVGDLTETAVAVRAGLAGDPDPAIRAELLGLAVLVALRADDAEAAEAARLERIALLRGEGRTAQADFEDRMGLRLYGAVSADDLDDIRHEVAATSGPERGRALVVLGELLLRAERAEDALTAFDEAETLIPDVPSDGRLAGVRVRRAVALGILGRIEESDSVLVAVADESGVPVPLTLQALHTLTRSRLDQGDADAAARTAERHLALWIALGYSEGIVDAASLAARAWSAADRDDEAAARIDYAIRVAERGELPTVDLRFQLGRYQLWSGNAEDARDTLEELYRGLDPDAEPIVSANVLFWLGDAARRTGDAELAYSAWMQAAGRAREAEDGVLAARAGISLGNLLSEYRDEDAVEVLVDALADARGAGDTAMIVEAQHALGRVRADFGDASGLDDLDAVYAIAVAEEAGWLAADITDSRARALAALGRLDDALAAFTTSADGYTEAGDLGRAAGSSVAAARSLVAADRQGDAVGWYRRALEVFPVGSGAHATISEELAEVLDALGRAAEAREVRAAAS